MTENYENFEYAGFWIRLWACIIDIVLYFILSFIITLPIFFLNDSMDYHLFIGWKVPVYDSSQSVIANLINFFLSMSLVFVVIPFWIYYQATPGKMAIGGKIVDAQTGNKPSTAQFIGRYFALYLFIMTSIFVVKSLWLDAVLYFLSILIFVVGIFWIGFDRRKQGWHDKLARTVVIKEKKYVKGVQFKNE